MDVLYFLYRQLLPFDLGPHIVKPSARPQPGWRLSVRTENGTGPDRNDFAVTLDSILDGVSK